MPPRDPILIGPAESGQAPLAELDRTLADVRADVAAITAHIMAELDQAVADVNQHMTDFVVQTYGEIDEHLQDVSYTVQDALGRSDAALNAAIFEALLAAKEAGANVPLDDFQTSADYSGTQGYLNGAIPGASVAPDDTGSVPPSDVLPPGLAALGPGVVDGRIPVAGSGDVGGIPAIVPFQQTPPGYQDVAGGSPSNGVVYSPIPGIGDQFEPVYGEPDLEGWWYHPPGDTDWWAGSVLPPGCEYTADGGIRCRGTPIGSGGTPGSSNGTTPPIPGVPPTTGGPMPRPGTPPGPPAPPPATSCPPVPPPLVILPPNPPPAQPPGAKPPTTPPPEEEEDCVDPLDEPILKSIRDHLCERRQHERTVDEMGKGSWCRKLKDIRPLAVELGKALMAGLTKPINEWILERQTLLHFMTYFMPGKEVAPIEYAIWNHWKGLMGSTLQDTLQGWAKIADRLGTGWQSDFFALAALRNYLRACEDSDVNASSIHTQDAGLKTMDIWKGQGSVNAGLKRLISAGVALGFDNSEWTGTGEQRSGIATIKIRVFLMPAMQCLDYLMASTEEMETLSVGQALQAYLTGVIDSSEYLCYCSMRGVPGTEARRIAHANRNQLTALEVITLEARGLITEGERDKSLRELGYLREPDRDALVKLFEQRPPATDLIRFMVRDVADRKIVERFQLDKEFTEKWTGPLPLWGRAIGITDELALNYWRAHWRLPGLHQAYECLHRLRPGTVNAKGEDIAVTREDVETLLGQDDVIPFWRERLIAISYHPLTRVDAQRMRMTGVIDDTELQNAFMDIGYAPENAKRLVGFTNRRRSDFLVKQKVCLDYVQGGASKDDVIRQLRPFNLSPAEFDDLWVSLDQRLRAGTWKACFKAFRRRYLAGELDDTEVMAEMRKIVDAPAAIIAAVKGWKCERASQERQVPATQLCQWFGQNLITEGDFRVRLARLGYTTVDAARIIAHCKKTVVTRLKEATDRRDAKIMETLDKAKKKKLRDDELSAVREARARRTADKEAAAEARRKAKLRKAAQEYGDSTQQPIDDAAEVVAQTVAYAIQTYDLTQVEAENMVLDALAIFDPFGIETLRDLVDIYARAEQQFDRDPGSIENPILDPAFGRLPQPKD